MDINANLKLFYGYEMVKPVLGGTDNKSTVADHYSMESWEN